MYECKVCKSEFSKPNLVGGKPYGLVIIEGKNAQCPSCLSLLIARQGMRINMAFESEVRKIDLSYLSAYATNPAYAPFMTGSPTHGTSYALGT